MSTRWQRPTIHTPFHIDMQWWEENNRDIRVFMRDILCAESRKGYEALDTAGSEIDWVDDVTGEVSQVDGLWHTLRMCCSVKPGYITPNTPIIEAVFRTFLANGNKPLTIQELYERLDRRPPQTLLRMLTGGQVYLGLRPLFE